ncbi:hypothetical protein MASR1M90_16870 [Desulfovibrionales bacterium]
MLNLNQLRDTDLPPLKAVVMRLWQLLNASETRLNDISEAMRAEPVLCARIMAVANSPIYRGVEDITSPQKALIRLGLQEVKGIVYYLTLADSVHKETLPSAFPMRRFWTHSLATALLSEQLLKYYGRLFPMTSEEKDGAYLAGLLHDIGYVVMATMMPVEFTAMSRFWTDDADHNPSMLEEKFFGLTHPVISAKALKLWKFPKSVQLAVYAHHRSLTDAEPPASIMLTKVADYLATAAGFAFNPLFSANVKRESIPAQYLDNDYQPIIEEVVLKVDMLVGQTFG